jgi:hypothetical protein
MIARPLAAVTIAVVLSLVGCVEVQPESFDVGVDRVPVVNADGDSVGTIPSEAIEEVTGPGDRVEVLDDDGVQVGWWTPDGFEPLSDT